jgi:ABC-type nitrate/sulfonate/bicarbonate transport system substrate-binding protein
MSKGGRLAKLRPATAYGTVFLVLGATVQIIQTFEVDGGRIASTGPEAFLAFSVACFLIGSLLIILRRKRTEVTVAEFSTNLAYLPLYIAHDLGYFRKEGLSVKFEQTYGDSATWRRVVEKNADFGVADPVVMLEYEGDEPGMLVASVVVKSPTRGITRRDMLPIRRPRELLKLPIRVFGTDTTSYKLLMWYLAKAGPPRESDIQIMEPNTEAAHLLDPVEPVVFTIDPVASAEVQNGAREVFSGTHIFGGLLNTGVFVRQSFISEKPDVVQAFVTGLEGALVFMHRNPGFTIEFAIARFKNAPRDAVMLGLSRLFAEGVFARHTSLDAHLWSTAVCRRFGEASVTDFRFDQHVEQAFADRAVRIVSGRTDRVGLRARLRAALGLKPR